MLTHTSQILDLVMVSTKKEACLLRCRYMRPCSSIVVFNVK